MVYLGFFSLSQPQINSNLNQTYPNLILDGFDMKIGLYLIPVEPPPDMLWKFHHKLKFKTNSNLGWQK